MAKCVNLRVSKYSIYIGRAGKGKDGYFGSPIVMHKPCPECGKIHRTNESTLLCYRKYVVRRVNTDSQFREKVKNLKNETLGCFCKPKACHGDVLVSLIDVLNKI